MGVLKMILLVVFVSTLLGCNAQIIENLSPGRLLLLWRVKSLNISRKDRKQKVKPVKCQIISHSSSKEGKIRWFFHPNLIRDGKNMELAWHSITPKRARKSVKQTLQPKHWTRKSTCVGAHHFMSRRGFNTQSRLFFRHTLVLLSTATAWEQMKRKFVLRDSL